MRGKTKMAKFKRRWIKIGVGAGAGATSLLAFFAILSALYGFQFIDYTPEGYSCVGSENYFCLTEFGIKNPSDTNVDIYSSDNLKLEFDDNGCITDYALFTKDGRCSATGSCQCTLKDGRKIGFDGWRCTDFTNATKPRKDVKYVFRFPSYTEKRFLVAGWKANRTCKVEINFPMSKGEPATWEGYSETDALKDYFKGVYNMTIQKTEYDKDLSPTHAILKIQDDEDAWMTVVMSKEKYNFITLNE